MDFVWPCLFAIFFWWFSTGIVLVIDRRVAMGPLGGRMANWGALALIMAVLVWCSGEATSQAAYLGFMSAIALWGWHELGFISGRITGPRPEPCPEGTEGWARFQAAVGTILWHELAIAGTVVVLFVLCHGGPNWVGFGTFVALWGLRLSTKINIFLGVPNMTVDLLPEHLSFLHSHFRKRPMNWVFPISITAATVAGGWVAHGAFQPGASGFDITGAALLSTLILLGMIEHWFLVLPIPDAALWHWLPGVTPRKPSAENPTNQAQAEPAL
ncbi:MAG: putative photosynthetic complex assembly protein PuhE [Pseudomonadota bacterium]